MAILHKEIKVLVGNLELGMHVVRLDRPWEETDFLLQNFIIQTRDDIEELSNQCDYVYIDAKHETKSNYGRTTPPESNERRKLPKGLFARFTKQKANKEKVETKKSKPRKNKLSKCPPKSKDRITYINKISTERQLSTSSTTYSSAKETVTNIMDGIRIGRMIDMNQARNAVNDIVDSVLCNKDALAWLTKIKNKDDYTAEHSLNVCVLAATFARHLGHAEHEIRHIALCGLLHDVGKSKIPTKILNKEGRFTDEEFDIMRQHTTFGRDLLVSLPKIDHIAIDVAHSHHERMDGSGYPRGLFAQQIPYYSKVIALVDCYDAITSSRCYDGARSSLNALDIIYKCKGVQFDEELALEFIKCIGIYPSGALVEFSNNELGIILSVNPENKLRPRVLLVLDSKKTPIKQKIIEMSEMEVDDFDNVYTISRELPNNSHGVDLRDFLKKGLVLGDSQNPSVPILE